MKGYESFLFSASAVETYLALLVLSEKCRLPHTGLSDSVTQKNLLQEAYG